MLNWDGVSLRAQRAKQSPLAQLINGEARFAPGIHLNEDFAEGLAPQFDAMGFARPARVALIESGQHVGALACARSAQEFGVASTGAPDSEAMLAMTLAGGALATKDALTALDTGIYVSNLWYLNFSDRQSCRITGMTRFATFWVERGRIVAPLAVMRFDDSLFRTLGSELEALTVDTEWMLDPSTYGSRSTRTARVPGALVRAMRFTL